MLRLCFLCVFFPSLAFSQSIDPTLYESMEYRCIGPFRGGRCAAVCGVPNDPLTYYMGSTGGGVWITEDGGQTWSNISDTFFGGSIGAVAVSRWDPNVIYVGGGEKTIRGNVSHGEGVYKSTDKGKTWKHVGLKNSRRIPRIRIHPKNPDLVYAAVMGRLFGPSEDRGLYRSKDGGKTWKRILFANNLAGVFELVMDPNNPRILFASTWRVRRTPYSLESGGEGSGLWKSTDSGDTWKNISHNKGLPKGLIGVIGIAVSPADSKRVFTIIESEKGGVFRSDDSGETWIRVNEERKLRQRAWYYSRIYADPKNRDKVYVLNVRFWRSNDGGKSFKSIRTPHSDHHDLWIDPHVTDRMVVGDDGGAQVTFNGGKQWSTYRNQPTAQFYRVSTDRHFPYRIYGAQQDNSTVRIPHRTDSRSITERDWTETAGGESGHIAVDPKDQEIVYGGSYGGLLSRLNHRTREFRVVNVWPDDPIGHGAEDMNPRFQWNFPLFFSIHHEDTLYAAGNKLFKTLNEGQSWEAVSPDLSRNDPNTLKPSGGPITKDNTGVEYYATIFAVAESLHDPQVIWAGTDDGLLHITKDLGKTWKNVTPPTPKWIQFNSLEAHPFQAGGLYVAATMYKSDDFKPYLYKTLDYGETWEKITQGIDPEHFTRVIRADPNRQGLLYAGTERGIYLSFNDGQSWARFQLNLPITPITDLKIKNNDLVVATQGRSFWVLDDLTLLHQMAPGIKFKDFWLFTPRPAYRMGGRAQDKSKIAGKNPPNGVVFHYFLKQADQEIALKILDKDKNLIKTFKPGEEDNSKEDSWFDTKEKPLPAKAGMNKFVWNMFYPEAEKFEGLVLWAGGTRGPKALPGAYQAILECQGQKASVDFEILKDPRSSSSLEALKEQFDFHLQIRDRISEIHLAIKKIRNIRDQINGLLDKTKIPELKDLGQKIIDKITKVEETLYQTKNRSRQDPLNFPVRLNNKLATLASMVSRGDFKPTDQARGVFKDLDQMADAALKELKAVMETRIPAFNKLVRDHNIPAILLKEKP